MDCKILLVNLNPINLQDSLTRSQEAASFNFRAWTLNLSLCVHNPPTAKAPYPQPGPARRSWPPCRRVTVIELRRRPSLEPSM